MRSAVIKALQGSEGEQVSSGLRMPVLLAVTVAVNAQCRLQFVSD